MGYVVLPVYAILALIALGNLLLMRRAPKDGRSERVAILIPARNEEQNLSRLLQLIGSGHSVFVFDDESQDRTVEVARQFDATVIQAREPLPEGWTGKNRACRELAKAASEAFDGEWLLFLDADTLPNPGFVETVGRIASSVGPRCPVVSGFPQMLPGARLEPLYLGWVPWILLASNPFGLVSRTSRSHNGFTNGQFVLWNSRVYWEVDPHREVCDSVLEDVRIGRLLKKKRVRVEVMILTSCLAVRMYRSFEEAVDGMSKNSYEVGGSMPACFLIAVALTFLAWGWAFCGQATGIAYATLVLSKFLTDRIVRYPVWTAPFLPITMSLAAFTFVRSAFWHRAGRIAWKGRTYDRR